MASFFAFVTIISLAFTIAKAQYNVTRGSSLNPTGANTSWLSPSGLYAFGFYPQTAGYAVGIYIPGISERTVVWTARRDTLPLSDNATLRFTSDGRLTVEQTPGQQINLFDTGGASFASMQDTGNFVLYDSTGRTVLWQSFDHPTETLLAGQRLLSGQTLFSSVSETDHSIGVFKLSMQTDGNLVLYPNRGTNDQAYWAAGTYTAGPNVTLNLDSSGFLYLLQNSTNLIYNLTQGGYPTKDALYLMKFDWDGIFRLYNKGKNGSVIWAWSTNKCAGSGLCGINGYCLVVNDAARCRCVPGFEFVNPEHLSFGCRRNDTVESCKILDASTEIQMTNLNNARWEDATYAIPIAPTQESCSSSCLNDCNCEAALFTGQQCKLQRLPLRYIEVIESESNVGLIKVYTSSFRNGSNIPTNQSIHVKKVRQKEIMVIGVSLISLAILVLLISGVIMYRTQVWAYKKISENLNVQLFEDVGPRAFSYAALEKMTDGFKEELGTRGYVAPEWHKRLPITVKVDVYSFGIVLFNILCCRKNVDNSLPDTEAILEEWVYGCYEAGEVLKLVDYDKDVEKRALEQMVKIGLWCVQEEPSLRPSMKRVVLMLEGTVKIPVPPNPTSFLSVD
ncbi:hypothetical protein L1987_61648 [Smallanthus sonchifolius]|uniref:Uncharacterized protein n=1 Tax=Smallanthus sonchifolius TaxID=185202 RepID=A0ACB9C886_9ASTR|nr:hypothetical protein L1987_61648 [Smallanthus sonchifolius]